MTNVITYCTSVSDVLVESIIAEMCRYKNLTYFKSDEIYPVSSKSCVTNFDFFSVFHPNLSYKISYHQSSQQYMCGTTRQPLFSVILYSSI